MKKTEHKNKSINLYIITNLFVLIEELSVVKDEKAYYTINDNYLKEKKEISVMKKKIKQMFPELIYIKFGDIDKQEWNEVALSSYIDNESAKLYKCLRKKRYIFVEDGTYDYAQDDFLNADIVKESDVWLFDTISAKSISFFKSAQNLYLEEKYFARLRESYKVELKSLYNIVEGLPIIFTSPLHEDYGMEGYINKIIDYLENIYPINTQILIKRHPRDKEEYKSLKLSFIECEKSIPGQLIDRMSYAEKYYFQPSTILFTTPNMMNSRIFQFSEDMCKYNASVYSNYFKTLRKIVNRKKGKFIEL